MIYKMSDPNAALECERQRTGNYGEDYDEHDDYNEYDDDDKMEELSR